MAQTENCKRGAPSSPTTRPKKKRKIQEQQSKYACVSWNANSRKWHAKISRGKVVYSGRYWTDDFDAAKAVNALCDMVEIPHKNPGIGVLKLPPLQRRIHSTDKSKKTKGKLVPREIEKSPKSMTDADLERILELTSDSDSDTSSSDGEYICTAVGGNIREPTMEIEDTSIDPWGVLFPLDISASGWLVERVDQDLQFFRKGIRPGWRLFKINGESCIKNEEKHREILSSGQVCSITFTIPNGKLPDFMTTERYREYERLHEMVPFHIGDKVDAFWEGDKYNDWFAAIIKDIDYTSKMIQVQFVGESEIQLLYLDKIRKYDSETEMSGGYRKFQTGEIVEAYWQGDGYNSWYLANIVRPCRRREVGYIVKFDGEKKMYVLEHNSIRKPIPASQTHKNSAPAFTIKKSVK